MAIVSKISGNLVNLTHSFTPEPKFNTHYKSSHARMRKHCFLTSSDHDHVCFDPCFTLRSWRASQNACRRISASTSTRTSSRAAKRFAGPLRDAYGPWPWGLRPPTHPLETPWSTAETSSPCSTLSPAAPLKSSKTTLWWPFWVGRLLVVDQLVYAFVYWTRN